MTTIMKIGEVARKTGKSVRALHLYEEMGLLNSQRSPGGFRLYGPDELARVYWIGKLQNMGFKLEQIRVLIEAVNSSDSAPEVMDGVREMFLTRLDATRQQIATLVQLERDLEESLAYLEDCRRCDETSTMACACCDNTKHQIPAPSLVAGIHLGRQRNSELDQMSDELAQTSKTSETISFSLSPDGIEKS